MLSLGLLVTNSGVRENMHFVLLWSGPWSLAFFNHSSLAFVEGLAVTCGPEIPSFLLSPNIRPPYLIGDSLSNRQH